MGLAYPQDAERPWRRPNCHRIVFLATPKTPDFEFWAFGPIGQKPSKTGVFQGVEKTCFRGSKPGKTCFRGGMSVNCYLENGQKVRKTVFDKGGVFGGGTPGGGQNHPKTQFSPFSQFSGFLPKVKISGFPPTIKYGQGKRGTTVCPPDRSAMFELAEDILHPGWRYVRVPDPPVN